MSTKILPNISIDPSDTLKVVRGMDATLTVQATDIVANADYPLTGLTGATAYFLAADSTRASATGTLDSDNHAKVNFVLSETLTASLMAGDELDLEVEVNIGSNKIISQILGKLEVLARLFQ